MAAQILKLVISAFFNLSRRIETIQEAVANIGLDIIRQLTLAQYLFAQCSEKERVTFRLDELWQYSLCTATLAKAIAIAEIGSGNAAIGNSTYFQLQVPIWREGLAVLPGASLSIDDLRFPVPCLVIVAGWRCSKNSLSSPPTCLSWCHSGSRPLSLPSGGTGPHPAISRRFLYRFSVYERG